jgi:hypothetical protein
MPLYVLLPLIGFLIWLVALTVAAGRAAKFADDAEEQTEHEILNAKAQWPEFEVTRLDSHALRRHTILVGDLGMPDRRPSR